MNNNSIAGTCKLQLYEFKAADGTSFFPYGKDAKGILIYDEGGYMSGMISKKDRDRLSSENISDLTDKDRIKISDGFISYSGKYEILPNRIVHHVEMSFFQNWVGKEID